MIPDVDTEEPVSIHLDGQVIRTCYHAMADTPDEIPFNTDFDNIRNEFRTASRSTAVPDGDDWLVSLERMEWVSLYGLLYTKNNRGKPDEDVQAAMNELVVQFDDTTTRLVEHTRDFYDAVQEEVSDD